MARLCGTTKVVPFPPGQRPGSRALSRALAPVGAQNCSSAPARGSPADRDGILRCLLRWVGEGFALPFSFSANGSPEGSPTTNPRHPAERDRGHPFCGAGSGKPRQGREKMAHGFF